MKRNNVQMPQMHTACVVRINQMLNKYQYRMSVWYSVTTMEDMRYNLYVMRYLIYVRLIVSKWMT